MDDITNQEAQSITGAGLKMINGLAAGIDRDLALRNAYLLHLRSNPEQEFDASKYGLDSITGDAMTLKSKIPVGQSFEFLISALSVIDRMSSDIATQSEELQVAPQNAIKIAEVASFNDELEKHLVNLQQHESPALKEAISGILDQFSVKVLAKAEEAMKLVPQGTVAKMTKFFESAGKQAESKAKSAFKEGVAKVASFAVGATVAAFTGPAAPIAGPVAGSLAYATTKKLLKSSSKEVSDPGESVELDRDSFVGRVSETVAKFKSVFEEKGRPNSTIQPVSTELFAESPEKER